MIKLLLALPFMLAAAYGTISDIEIVFLVITLIGSVFSAVNIRNAWGDRRYLRQIPQAERNGEWLIAKQYADAAFVAEFLRFFMQVILFTIAGFSATIPEPANAIAVPLKYAIFGFIFRWGLTAIAIGLAYKSYLTKRTRDIVRSTLEK